PTAGSCRWTAGAASPPSARHPVETGADVAGRVEGAVAQRALAAAGRDDLLGTAGELARLRTREPHPQHRSLLAVRARLRAGPGLRVRTGELEALEDEAVVLRVPAQAHRAHAELRVDRHDETRVVLDLRQRGGRDAVAALRPRADEVQQFVDAFGEDLDLLLLQCDGVHAPRCRRLEVERPLAG